MDSCFLTRSSSPVSAATSSQFPLGDKVTIYLPDYTRARVERFVTSKVFEDTQYEEDLARHFKAVKPMNGFLQCEKAKTEVEENFEDLEENEVPNDVQEKIEKTANS